jgi:ribonuclease E
MQRGRALIVGASGGRIPERKGYMVKRMLIDATHLEETRVVIANGTRLDEFDFESSTKKQLKGNIYLAKVTRVEPSLQAAFVDFGGNRHGFLPFSEIHPDYYQIPVADRMALLAEQQRMGGYGESDADFEPVSDHGEQAEIPHAILAEPPAEFMPADAVETTSDSDATLDAGGEAAAPDAETPAFEPEAFDETAPTPETEAQDEAPVNGTIERAAEIAGESAVEPAVMPLINESADQDVLSSVVVAGEATDTDAAESGDNSAPSPVQGEHLEVQDTPQHLEMVGGADEVEAEVEGAAAERRRGRMGRHRYKIQEVIKRRQILLVQVVKEERGNKGAALTTYLSLAGRYCVLMPNTARGGGISRKISSPADRKRLKSYLDELDIPEGMAVILRTAAVERSKSELKRDYEYLLRQWDEVRELTLKSIAPALVYEEANLIKRSIRDHYTKDVDEVLVEGDEGYRTAKEFMRMLMPSHAKKVQQYRDPEIPLFHRYQIENQLDAMHNPVVTLKSGGYIVINPTEALVAIDVNSGRATRERNIEETAYKTNVEAADEIARQLRLRDLAGLIVIDFIDMEESRNQHNVEKRLKEAMRVDRARIQIGKISPFGLLELSRQRLRPSFLEASTERCPHCAGSGLVRSTESAALHVIRAVEEEGIRRRSAEIRLVVPTGVALYILNHKRSALVTLEGRYGFHIIIETDDTLIPPNFRLERLKAQTAPPPTQTVQAAPPPSEEEAQAEAADELAAEAEEQEEAAEERDEEAEIETREAEEGRDERRGRRSRRRRRRGEDRERGDRRERRERPAAHAQEGAAEETAAPDTMEAGESHLEAHEGEAHAASGEAHAGDGDRKRRRRGKRGGRRRRRHEEGAPGAEGGRGEGQGHENAAATHQDWQPSESAPVTAAERYEPAEPRERPAEPPAYEHAIEHRGNGSAEPRAAESPSEPSRPKRKGWWQRLTQ